MSWFNWLLRMLTRNKVSDILHSGDMFLLLFGLICHYVFFCVMLLHGSGGGFCPRVPVVLVLQAWHRFSCSFLWTWLLEERPHISPNNAAYHFNIVTVRIFVFNFSLVSVPQCMYFTLLMGNFVFELIILLLSLSATHKYKHLYFCYNTTRAVNNNFVNVSVHMV